MALWTESWESLLAARVCSSQVVQVRDKARPCADPGGQGDTGEAGRGQTPQDVVVSLGNHG